MLSFAFASNHHKYEAKPQTYTIRITSKDPAISVPFTGSYMISSDNEKKIARVDKVTPYEIVETTNSLDFMFMAMKNIDSFQVEILEKDGQEEHERLRSTASSCYGFISTDGFAMIGS